MKSFFKGIIWLFGSFMAFGIAVGAVIATLDYFEIDFNDDVESKAEPVTIQKPSVKKKNNNKPRQISTDYLSDESKKTLDKHFKKLERESKKNKEGNLIIKKNELGLEYHNMVKTFKFKNKTCRKPTPPSQHLEEYDYDYQAKIFIKRANQWINCVNNASTTDTIAFDRLIINIGGKINKENGTRTFTWNSSCNCEKELISINKHKKNRHLARQLMLQKSKLKWKKYGFY